MKSIRVIALALVTGLTLSQHGYARSQTTYNITLSHAEASVDDSGRTVVTVMAQGDLQGVFTLKFERADDGTVTGGEWALSVSYTESLPGPPAEDGDAREGLVQKGVLKGTLAGGFVTLSDVGGLSSLSNVKLTLTGGTLAYEGITSGDGSISCTGIPNRDESNGAITLAF